MALKTLGHDVILADRPDERMLADLDVLIVVHNHRPGLLEVIKDMNKRGATTVFETDDDYWAIHPENPAASYWTAERLGEMNRIVRECSVVTVSTEELAQVVRPMNANVRVLRNMLPDEHWPAERKLPNSGDDLVLGWAGSPSHVADMRIILPVMKQLLDEYPRLTVRLAGAPEQWSDPHPRIELVPWVKVEEYASVLQGFDIGVAPVQDTRFNRCKSDLKFVEYSIVGIPTVASQVQSYIGSIKPGVNGYLARNTKDWLKHLRRLIESPDLREQIASEAHAYAQTRLMSTNVHRWEKTYGLDVSVEPSETGSTRA
ncbi:MAG: glycosyltransferase family 4 protein [Coriobacteriia bacterium]|nr:glycosyltransferase family 4 protein [Coriobacteriia bacterium]